MKKVPYRVPKLAAKGLGKPWMAECHKPWVAGDPSSATYIYGRQHISASVFFLEPGRVYFCSEPRWKRPQDDKVVLAEDDQIESRRFYLYVNGAGVVSEISESTAEELLSVMRPDRQDL